MHRVIVARAVKTGETSGEHGPVWVGIVRHQADIPIHVAVIEGDRKRIDGDVSVNPAIAERERTRGSDASADSHIRKAPC